MDCPIPILFNQTLEKLIPLETKNILFLFDFDGTLSPIIPNRNEAKMDENTFSLFQKLSSISKTGILTGRRISDVKNRIPKNTLYLIGEHGIESDFKYIDNGILNLIQNQISNLYSQLINSIKPLTGIEIERKKYSLTIHYRNIREPILSLNDLFNNPKNLENFEVKNGDKIFNIFSKNSPNKGTYVIYLFNEFEFD